MRRRSLLAGALAHIAEAASHKSYAYCLGNFVPDLSLLNIFPFEGSSARTSFGSNVRGVLYDPVHERYFCWLAISPLHTAPGIFALDLINKSVTILPGTEDVIPMSDVAIAGKGEALIFCGVKRGDYHKNAALYRVRLLPVVVTEQLNLESPIKRPKSIGVSPDANVVDITEAGEFSKSGNKAVIIRRVYVQTGSVTPILQGFVESTWSPDGHFVVARRIADYKAVLFEAKSLHYQRELDADRFIWSPDSRFLIKGRYSLLCRPDTASIGIIDVNSGAQQVIKSSRCRWFAGQLFWMSVLTAAAIARNNRGK